MTRRAALTLFLTTSFLAADEGGRAPETRWNHARGPASCSGMSDAEPPESFGRIVWTHKSKGGIRSTPVVWDGAVFVVDGTDARTELLALDAEKGEVWARTAVRQPGQPTVYSRSVILVEGGTTLVQIRLAGRAFLREWTYDAGAGVSAPRVLDGEIYVTTPRALLSLRAGLSQPAWKVDGTFTGDPAVRGDHVYALRRDGAKLVLSAYARADGKEVTSVALGERAGTGGRIAVGNHIAAVLLPPEQDRTWTVLSRKAADGALELTVARTEKLLTDPLAVEHTMIALAAEPKAWTQYYTEEKQARLPRVAAADRPELFESPVAPIWLGEACQCYGDWCGDVISNIIFWHARERPAGAVLRKGLRCNAVPVRSGLLLLVPADGASILALAPEEVR